MQTEPAFRISVWPFGSGRDPRAVTFHVHQIVGPEPVELGTKGQPLTPHPTITLAELLAEVESVVSGLGGPDRPHRPHGRPLPVGDGRNPENMT